MDGHDLFMAAKLADPFVCENAIHSLSFRSHDRQFEQRKEEAHLQRHAAVWGGSFGKLFRRTPPLGGDAG